MKITSLSRFIYYGLLVFIWFFSFHLQAADNKRSGLFIDFGANYYYSRLERQEEGGSNFSLLSQSGYSASFDVWGYMSRYTSLTLNATAFSASYSGPSSRVIQDKKPMTTDLGLELAVHILREIKIFLKGHQRGVVVMEDINSLTHKLKPVAVTAGTLGFSLAAESKIGYQIEVTLQATAGAGEVDFNSEKVKLNYSAQAQGKLLFGSRKGKQKYGLLVDMWLTEVSQGDKKYIGSNASAGFFLSRHF